MLPMPRQIRSTAMRLFVAAMVALLLPIAAHAAAALGATGLRARHAAVAAQLAASPFGSPLLLESVELAGRMEGDVYAIVDQPFAQLAVALGEASHWCDILILHLNTKSCSVGQAAGTRVDLRVGRKEPQPLKDATLLSFRWTPPMQRRDYLAVQMDAPEGPYGTRDYALLAEAVPLDAGHSFLHMAYGFGHGAASSFAMKLYLATVGGSKVGFTREHGPNAGDEGFVAGTRGVVERNTMRYYLAIQAYLAAPGEAQQEERLATWFDATERYPRQLHEVERDAYLRMKRDEVKRRRTAD